MTRSYMGSLPAAVRKFSDPFLLKTYDKYSVYENSKVKDRDAVYFDIVKEELDKRTRPKSA